MHISCWVLEDNTAGVNSRRMMRWLITHCVIKLAATSALLTGWSM
jgi:hypothetical protein